MCFMSPGRLPLIAPGVKGLKGKLPSTGIQGTALRSEYPQAFIRRLKFNEHYFSEIDAYAHNIYQLRFPDAKSLGDIRNVDRKILPLSE